MADFVKPLEVGQTVAGEYVVEHLLGMGGLGVTYLARQASTERLVVLKLILSNSARERERFAREARLLSSFQHPNVASYIDFVVDDERAYLVLEYVADAVTLDKWQSGREAREVIRLYATLAETLAAMHRRGLVHRDLKPSNVLVRKTGAPALIDFGLAIQLGEHDSLTGLGTITGTPAYMSPEGVRGKTQPEAAADIYSMGVMLFEALTGQLPEGKLSSIGELLNRRASASDPARSWFLLIRSKLGSELAFLTGQMLSSAEVHRPAAEEVASVLRATRRGRGIVVPFKSDAVAGSRYRRRTFGVSPNDVKSGTARPKLQWGAAYVGGRPRFPAPAVAAALLLIAILAVVVNSAFSERPKMVPSVGFGLLVVLSASLAFWLIRKARRDTPPPGSAPVPDETAQRIAAIETHLERTNEFTKSLAIRLEDLVKEQVHNAVRESLVVALRELKPTEQKPASDMQRLIDLLEKLVGPKPSSKSWGERLQIYLGIPVVTIAAVTGVVGLLSSLEVWKAKRPPEIASFTAEHPAVRPGGGVDLIVDAKDPNGGLLTFEYWSSEGLVEANGPRARLLVPANPKSPTIVAIAKVSNGGSALSQKTVAVSVRRAPVGDIVFTSDVVAGKTVEVRADVNCDAPEALRYSWQAEAGTFQPETGASVFFKVPAMSPTTVTVACNVADEIGTVRLSKSVPVKRATGR